MDERPDRAGLDMLGLQLFNDGVTIQAGILQVQAEEPVVGAAFFLAEGQDVQTLDAVQGGDIVVVQFLFVGDKARQPFQLGQARQACTLVMR